MKTFTIYKSMSNLWFVEHSLKNSSKVRRIPIIGNCMDCITRFEKNGYVFINKYGYAKNNITLLLHY